MDSGLFHAEFPIYAIEATDDGHVVVAGGGGTAKTGVPNRLELYALSGTEAAVLAGRNAAGLPDTVMNIALHRSEENGITCVAGIGATLNKFTFSKATGEDAPLAQSAELTATVTSAAGKDGVQTCVRWTADGRWIATGASAGQVKVWEAAKLKVVHALGGLEPTAVEVEDLGFDGAGERIVSVTTGSNSASVWTIASKECASLTWTPPSSAEAKHPASIRFCRFVTDPLGVEGIVTVSTCARKAGGCSYLTLWDAASLKPKWNTSLGADRVSCLATSPDGKWVATGDLEGHVTVTSVVLGRVFQKSRPRHSVVTALTFFTEPTAEGDGGAGADAEVTVLSVGIDRFCMKTRLAGNSRLGWWLMLLVLLLLLAVTVAVVWPQACGALFNQALSTVLGDTAVEQRPPKDEV